MQAIRIRRQIDSETLYLPEVRPLIGKMVEIIVLEEPVIAPNQSSADRYDAFFALAGQNVIDPDALRQLRGANDR